MVRLFDPNYRAPQGPRRFTATQFGELQVLGFAVDAFGWPAITKPLAMLAVAIGSPVVIFNASRLIAWVFPIIAGALIQAAGSISHAAMALGSIYILGLIVPWLMPETCGRALPQ